MPLKSNSVAGSVLIVLMLVFNSVSAQNVVKGSINNKSDNQPIQGASVTVKGSTTGTQTNDGGTFSFNVSNSNSVLVISAVGFETKEISLGGKTDIGVFLLTPSNVALNEIVVTVIVRNGKKTLSGRFRWLIWKT